MAEIFCSGEMAHPSGELWLDPFRADKRICSGSRPADGVDKAGTDAEDVVFFTWARRLPANRAASSAANARGSPVNATLTGLLLGDSKEKGRPGESGRPLLQNRRLLLALSSTAFAVETHRTLAPDHGSKSSANSVTT